MPENGGDGNFISALRCYAEERLKRVGAIQSFSSTAGEDSYASREERERRKIDLPGRQNASGIQRLAVRLQEPASRRGVGCYCVADGQAAALGNDLHSWPL